MLQAGDCYLITTNTDSRGYSVMHLHILILDGEEYTQNTIVVQINTFDSERQDQTTFLHPGEHEFITKKSFVVYKRSRIRSTRDIQRNIDDGIAIPKDRFDDKIVERIQEGIMRSPHTPLEVKDAYSRYMFRKIKK